MPLVVAAAFSPKRAAAAEIPPATKDALRTSDLIYVATKRKNGQPSAAKPIWFFYEEGDELFFTTQPPNAPSGPFTSSSTAAAEAASANGLVARTHV